MGLYIGNQRVCPAVRVKGADSQGEFLVTVIDYDGTVLYQDHLNTGARVYMPPAPNHEGLTFLAWSAAVPISNDGTNDYIEVNGQDITVGATYNTVSTWTEFDITLNENTGLTVTLKMSGTKYWGDGTTSPTNIQTHTYEHYGDYTIICDGTSWGSNSSSGGLFGQTSTAVNWYVKAIRIGSKVTSLNSSYMFQYCSGLKSVVLPTKPNPMGSSIFRNCNNLRAVVIPNGCTSIGSYCFYASNNMVYIVVPSTVTTFNSNVFNGLSRLRSFTFPPSMTTMSSGALQSCSSLEQIKLPGGAYTLYSSTLYGLGGIKYLKFPVKTSIPAQFCSAARNCEVFDFSDYTSVPTLANVNAFSTISPVAVFKIPSSLLSSWKAASNWSTYANQMIGV